MKRIKNENKSNCMTFNELSKFYNDKPTKYSDFCKTSDAKEYGMTDEESNYYKEKFGNGIRN